MNRIDFGKHGFIVGLIVFAGIALFLTFNRHSKTGYFNYHSELWADRAGYYVYLPAAIKFGFNPENFPDSIDKKTGYGFWLDYHGNRIVTKYTYGVALLQLPFFLLADLLAEQFGFKSDGFSRIYHWSIDVAAVFYLIVGLFFLAKFLRLYYPMRIVFLVLVSLFLATNIYYYSIDESGMSHIYSFSLFCITLFLLKKTNCLRSQDFLHYLILGILSGLIVLIRPTNILFLSAFFLLDLQTKKDFMSRIANSGRPKVFLSWITGLFAVFLPQMIYWKTTYGSFVTDTYRNEGFNWLEPKPLLTWFSPNNGLLPYCLFFLIILASLVFMVRRKAGNGLYLSGLFLVLSYLVSCWYQWDFGCSFGARSYVEYLAIFSIPVAYLFDLLHRKSVKLFLWLCFLVFVLAAVNLKLTYTYDGCFPSEKNWDWTTYFNMIVSPPK